MKKRIPKLPDSPLVDPTGMNFETFREAHVWGPEDEHRTRKCINQDLAREGLHYWVSNDKNEYFNRESEYNSWDRVLECGRNYLVGPEVPMKRFLAAHTSSLNGWQRLAFWWCQANPDRVLVLRGTRCGSDLRGCCYRHYEIGVRGEYVQIGLPHQDAGGEKHWVTRNGKTKVLINVD